MAQTVAVVRLRRIRLSQRDNPLLRSSVTRQRSYHEPAVESGPAFSKTLMGDMSIFA